MTPLERAVTAAWDELERQREEGKLGPYVDRHELSIIDGEVDMPALVRAVFDVVREEIEAGALAGAEQAADHGSAGAQQVVDALRQVVDMLDPLADDEMPPEYRADPGDTALKPGATLPTGRITWEKPKAEGE